MPELPEMEIIARRLDPLLHGRMVSSIGATGVNVIKSFDPPLDAWIGTKIDRVRRRGKLLLFDSEAKAGLSLIIHLMTAGRIRVTEKRPSIRDRKLRFWFEYAPERFVVMREYGTKQTAWIKTVKTENWQEDEAVAKLGPEAWPGPLDGSLIKGKRSLNAILRDQHVLTGIGRTWADDILHRARLSPYKRADDLTLAELDALMEAIPYELGRVIDVYEQEVQLPLPDKFPKPTIIHRRHGESCPRCGSELQSVFMQEHVMTYCPICQTDGRILKDRRMSRLLK